MFNTYTLAFLFAHTHTHMFCMQACEIVSVQTCHHILSAFLGICESCNVCQLNDWVPRGIEYVNIYASCPMTKLPVDSGKHPQRYNTLGRLPGNFNSKVKTWCTHTCTKWKYYILTLMHLHTIPIWIFIFTFKKRKMGKNSIRPKRNEQSCVTSLIQFYNQRHIYLICDTAIV